MAHYPIIKLPHEYMLIGASSGLFNSSAQGFQDELFYIGDDKCGWSGCNINVTSQITREYTEPIPINFGNCAIKNPIDLIPGDLITLCGTATCMDAEDGMPFGAALEYVDCDQVTSEGFQTTYAITNNKAFQFSKKYVCWGITYTVPPELYLDKCKIAFVAGFSANLDAEVKITWTLNINRGGYAPPSPPFQ